MQKLILDTSVLIATFYKSARGPSFSKDVYDYAVESAIVYVSQEILNEFHKNCIKKLRLNRRETSALESLILQKTQMATLKKGIHASNFSIRDVGDRHIVELALTVDADFILSWDKDLLVLKEVNKTKILTPKNFWMSL